MHPARPSAIGRSKAEPSFANVSRGEVDRDTLAVGKLKGTVAQGRLNPLAAFLKGIVRQAHNVKRVHASRTYVNLDFNNLRVNSIHGGAECF
jgi:hypothetical protein